MAGISLTAVESLPDVLGNWRFELDITPSATADQNIVQALKLRCQQVDFSGVTIETVSVGLHGHEMNFRGRQTFSKTISATFIETVDGAILNSLLNWKEIVVGTRSGNGAYRQQYSALGSLGIIDTAGAVVHQQQIFYMWPTEVSNISLDGASSGPISVSTTWSFDFVVKSGIVIDAWGQPATE